MTLFPPDQEPPIVGSTNIPLNARTEKTVLDSFRTLTRLEKDAQTRLHLIRENIDLVLTAFATGGIIASERMLAAIAERENRQAGTPAPKRRPRSTGVSGQAMPARS